MYVETAHDYMIKYKDTFLVWKKGEDNIPCRALEFSGEGRTITAKIRTYPKKPMESETVVVKVPELRFNFLPRGCINLRQSVIVLNEASPKNGEHKYRACMNQTNTQLIDPFVMEREMIHSTPVEFENHVVLNAIIDNVYPAPNECLENVLTFKRLGQAFSSDYFFGLKYKPNGCMLFRREYMVGRVDMSKGTILLKAPAYHLYEELSEFGFSVERID